MNDKFDELAKGLAQSVTRRGALKKFGAGVVGVVLASLGLARKANATSRSECSKDSDCPGQICCHCSHLGGIGPHPKICLNAGECFFYCSNY